MDPLLRQQQRRRVREVEAVKIPIGQLRCGMYVSKLDRDWLETPFLMQGFYIDSQDTIDILAEYCKHVYIDEERNKFLDAALHATGLSPNKDRSVHYSYSDKKHDEQRRALGLYKEAHSMTKSMLFDIKMGGTVDTDLARSTVKDLVASLLRNPDSLLLVSKLREESDYTANHCLNVCILAVAFARKMGMPEEDLVNLGFCGLMHDIGMLQVPKEILQKPSGLSTNEFKIVQSHPVFGRNILMSTRNVYEGSIDVAYTHHERLDGLGYPNKLPAQRISRFSRMIALVDTYDAVTTHRSYAKATSSTTALKQLYKDRGTKSDPILTLEFIRTVGLYPPGSLVELKNGCVGFVVSINHKSHHLPEVVILLDEEKKACSQKLVRLSETATGALDPTYLIQRVLHDGAHELYLNDFRNSGFEFSY